MIVAINYLIKLGNDLVTKIFSNDYDSNDYEGLLEDMAKVYNEILHLQDKMSKYEDCKEYIKEAQSCREQLLDAIYTLIFRHDKEVIMALNKLINIE